MLEVFNVDKKQKITILGAGNGGCLTALHFGFYLWGKKNIEVELIHNPDIEPQKMGEGTLCDLPKHLWETCGFNLMENQLDATINMGIMYEGWGKKNEMVPMPYPSSRVAIHISPDKLQDYILKSGYFKVTEEDVDNKSYDDIDSDIIVDCRKPSKEDFDNGLYHVYDGHVNSIILANQPGADLRQHWTKSIATPDGWCYVIPLGDNTTSYGYLYDNRITTDEQAKVNMQGLFHVQLPVSMGPSKNVIHFDQYIAKEPIIDNRIILGGEKLFFFEPLEESTMSTYATWNHIIWDWFVDGGETPKTATKEIQKVSQQVMSYLNWHYSFGSKYQTPFWMNAKKKGIANFVQNSKKDRRIMHVIKLATENSPRDLRYKLLNNEMWDFRYCQWDVLYFNFWIDGMTKKLPDHQRYPFI